MPLEHRERRELNLDGKIYLTADETASYETNPDNVVRLRLKEYTGEKEGNH